LKSTPRTVCLLVTAACGIGAAPAVASTYLYSTPGGAKNPFDNSQPVLATAQFTFTEGELEIVLTNGQQDVRSAGQAISGLSFQVDNRALAFDDIDYAAFGQLTTINKGGGYTAPAATGEVTSFSRSSAIPWLPVVAAVCSGARISFNVLSNSVNDHLLIGLPNSSTHLYSNANSSIFHHDPFLYNAVTFIVRSDEIHVNPNISNVLVSFGTARGGDVRMSATADTVPEPGTATLIGGGLLLSAGVAARRRSRRR
jgi:hypothetical protein